MEQLVMQLINKACAEQVVTSQPLANGMQVLAYPLPVGELVGVLVGVGYESDLAHRVQPEALLHKRSTDLARFGDWLPTLFTDGSCYVVRRLTEFNHALVIPALSDADLMAAQELLS